MDKISTSQFAECQPLVVWQDLPDPRDPAAAGKKVSIVVDPTAWEEHVARHVVNRGEPWDSVLETATIAALRKAHAAGIAVPLQVLQQALERLELEIRRSLERPLAIVHEVRHLGSSSKHVPHVWLLLLPCGATAYVRQGGWGQGAGVGYLATCYFPRAATVEPNRERRWARVLRDLVVRYGLLDQRRGLLPPDDQHVVSVVQDGVVREFRSAIHFVTLESWGFRVELAGSPWRGRLAPWVPAPPAARPPYAPGPPQRPRSRSLKSRRRIWEDNDGA